MHVDAVGRPGEALQLSRSVLDGGFALSPRLRALFLTEDQSVRPDGRRLGAVNFPRSGSLFLDGVDGDDPAWAWWIDERELAWHEAMAGRDLRQVKVALSGFEHSMEVTAPTQTGSLYHHLAHLLQALRFDLRSWTEVEADRHAGWTVL
jgi:hypothetical protein